MNMQEAEQLCNRIRGDLPKCCIAMVQTRLFSNRWTITVMWKDPTPGMPHHIPGMPVEITSYRQWRANRHKAVREDCAVTS